MLNDEMKKKLNELHNSPNASVLFEYKEFTLFKEVDGNCWSWIIIYPIMNGYDSRCIMVQNLLCSSIFNNSIHISNLTNGSSIALEKIIRESKQNLEKEIDLFYESLEVKKIDHSSAIIELENVIDSYLDVDDLETVENINRTIDFLQEI